MRFLEDECCDTSLIASLRSADHDVRYAVESLQGNSDTQILTKAYSEERILITEDKDFGELVYRLRRPTHGIILLRFDVKDRSMKIPRMQYLLENYADRLPGAFTVLDSHKIRIRPLQTLVS
jgi:predicted nuclease of predicted toxin-antitoxin system